MTSWEYMFNNKMLERGEIESKLPFALYELHKLTTKILRDNNVLQEEEEKKGEPLEIIVPTVMKLQSMFLA